MKSIALALAVVAWLAAPAAASEGTGKITGRLADVRPDGTLVVEEQGPWKGPGTGVVTRGVDLTPATTIRVVRPTGRWESTDPHPGYQLEPTDFRVLRRGDFITVTTDGRSTAIAVDVVRPDGAEGGMASPGFDAGK